jgi:hypothetical protein
LFIFFVEMKNNYPNHPSTTPLSHKIPPSAASKTLHPSPNAVGVQEKIYAENCLNN